MAKINLTFHIKCVEKWKSFDKIIFDGLLKSLRFNNFPKIVKNFPIFSSLKGKFWSSTYSWSINKIFNNKNCLIKLNIAFEKKIKSRSWKNLSAENSPTLTKNWSFVELVKFVHAPNQIGLLRIGPKQRSHFSKKPWKKFGLDPTK